MKPSGTSGALLSGALLCFLTITITLLYDWRAAIAISISVAVAAGMVLQGFLLLLKRSSKTMLSQFKSLDRRLQGYISLTSFIGWDRPVPPLTGWRLSPDNAVELVRLIFDRAPTIVVELGSGSSTILVATVMERINHGHIFSVEHEERFAAQTRTLVEESGLSHRVTILAAPLMETLVGDRMRSWYDPSFVDRIPGAIDLLLVDGPPGRASELARYPALPLMEHRLSSNAVVLLDDARRAAESTIINEWTQEFPEWNFLVKKTSSGLGVGSRVAD